MYRAFRIDNIKIDDTIFDELDTYSAKYDRSHNNCHDSCLYQYLRRSMAENTIMSGGIIQEQYFPVVNTDVFLSHSHRDKGLAIKIANWLRATFELDVFIDSYVWGHSDRLIKEIVDIYIKKTSKKPDDDQLNRLASHVYMILAGALTKMIDQAEVVFFSKYW
ncbi:MAG TPA: hypothetical protein GX525_03900 [Bacilli bacterium]|nr:hypothetical protein [Bacilli bacterium]